MKNACAIVLNWKKYKSINTTLMITYINFFVAQFLTIQCDYSLHRVITKIKYYR